MSVLGHLKYHLGVSAVGNRLLRLERRRLERLMATPGFWKHEHLNEPLKCSPHLKELISRHYLKGRYADRRGKVAWVTSGAPLEFLTALGYYILYPENHAALCGIRRKAEGLCSKAEDAGFSRDICSYARTDFGSLLCGETPVGRLPRPDLLLCCTNICQTVLYWYQVLADHFKVPLVLIDTPFLYDQAPDHAVEYVGRQIASGIEVAEKVAGKSLDQKRLREVAQNSSDACMLWMQVLESCKARPAPITAFEEFIHMAPIVEMRGHAYTVNYYKTMLAEIRERVSSGQGALIDERKRVLWDNLPIWHQMKKLGDRLASHGVALVASTYTNAWGELAPMMDPDRPLETAARVYLHPILNRSTADKLMTMRALIEEYQVDGVILHSDRSCKPYSIGQMSHSAALAADPGVPSLLLEADHNDPRAYSSEQADGRLEAFVEMLCQ